MDRSQTTPSSPPPSFRSRASSVSRTHLLSHDPLASQADQALADSFDHPSEDDGSESGDDAANGDDRRGLLHRVNNRTESFPDLPTGTLGGPDVRGGQDGERPYVTRRPPAAEQRRMTELPRSSLVPSHGATGVVYGGGSASDGVFANLDAKPERGEKTDEQPPVCSLLSCCCAQLQLLTSTTEL